MAFAGGIVTNANLSAAYIRMPAQDATLGIDAVYYNPAGVAFLADGFYIQVNNQYISQSREITTNYPNINRTKFEGGVLAPLFPTFYMVYKKDKVAFSFGLEPVGGGGSAKFDNGLPSFEQQIAAIPAALTAKGIATSQYSLETSFEGKSIIWGLQANGSYAINDMVSISVGFRYLIAKNSYVGYMKNIQINPNQPAFNQGANVYTGSMVSATQFFTDAATTFTGWATGATQFSTALQGLFTAVPASATTLLSDGATVGLSPTQVAQIQGLLGAAGQSPAAIAAMNLTQARTVLVAAAPVFTANANGMTANANNTKDKEVDAEQNGSGIAPILGVNLKVSDQLNIGIRYEYKAEMNVTNKTKVDNTGLYGDGLKTPFDMPSTLSVGVAYKATDKLAISSGFHYYFDKKVNYGKKDYYTSVFVDNKKVIDKNFWEFAIGAEYSVTDKLLVSAGYLRTQTGVNEKYQSDLSHSLSTNTFGAGLKYTINDMIAINFGGMLSMYLEDHRMFAPPAIFPVNFTDTYNRSTIVAAIGVDIKL